MKGGLVILLGALAALREVGSPAFTDTGITVFFNSDEEVLSPTSGPLITNEARKVQTACVLEPAGSNGGYIFVRKGAGKYFLRVRGNASHAGRHPERGISANLELAHKIIRLHNLTDLEAGTTVNVGVISGGERANVVCPEAYAEIDLRAFTRDEIENTVLAMQQQIAGESIVSGTETQFWGDLLFEPLPRRRVNEQLFELVRTVAHTVGFEACEFISGGGSDGNNAGQVVATMDGMGPCGDGAHTEDEFVILDSLVERAQVLALFLNAWPNHIESVLATEATTT